jgi:hypothetical protein
MDGLEFVKYCMSYYGKGQLYDLGAKRSEILEALIIRLSDPRWEDYPFAGDSMDRELVRDIMLHRREGTEQ